MRTNKIYQLLIFGFAIVGIIQLFSFAKKIEKISIENSVFYAAKSHPITDSVFFCGERVPLEVPDIMERYDKEIIKNAYWHSSILLFYKRIGKYFPVIEPILKKHNIPNDFKYLAIAESGLKNVVSPAGARGFWQIMEKTGQEYGLEINKEVDERYNLELATEAACKYLNESYKKFGSWTLVAASYNMGMYGLAKNMERQKTNNYYDLLLNSETSRYLFRIVAIKEILENPKKYGFNLTPKLRYQDFKYKTVTVDTSIQDFTDFAIEQNINYKYLKLANPWLRRKYLKNSSGKKYKIKIPTSGFSIMSDLEYYQPDSLDSAQTTIKKPLSSDSLVITEVDTLSDENSIISDSTKKNLPIEK